MPLLPLEEFRSMATQNDEGDENLRKVLDDTMERAPRPDSSADDSRQNNLSEEPEDLSEVMDFSSYNLGTTIRLIVLSGEGRRIDVQRGSRKGRIYIKAGEIYRVETAEHEGDEAFFEILAWDRSVHKDCKEVDPPEPNMRISTKVLLETMKNRTYSR
jgi:hypothetical protein